MIKLFRNIRKQLLNEGKITNPALPTGRHLKYAVGEILLVVIGILIALQANNWNENRKESGIEQEYLSRLQTEIEKDHKTLLFSKDLANERIHQVEILSEAITHPDSLFNNPNEIIEIIEKVTWLSYLPLSRIVFNELQTTGNMTLIHSKEIREQLATYYAEANHWEMILNAQEYQKEFGHETAGLLSKDILAHIENSEPLYMVRSKKKLDFNLTDQEFNHIIKILASKTGATKLLPQIYHYHILSKKVIDLLISKNEELFSIINNHLK
ncbi:DUF6090 family protein [Flavobacteriaceae bacterium LMO-SS05]